MSSTRRNLQRRRFSDYAISAEDRAHLAKVDKQRAHLAAIHEPGAAARHPPLHGLLEKLSSKGKWQARWFEAKDHFLTYRQTEKSKKTRACIGLRDCGLIAEGEAVNGISAQFSLELDDRRYMIKIPAPWTEETPMADIWVDL